MAKMPAEKKRVTYPPVGQKRVCAPNHVERMLGNDVKFTIIPHPLTKKKNHAEALRHWETVIRSTLQDPHANDIADLIADKAHDLETDVREENY